MISLLDYILLDNPTALSDGNVDSFGVPIAFIETPVENRAFRRRMKSLCLQKFEHEGTPDYGQQKSKELEKRNVPTVTYSRSPNC